VSDEPHLALYPRPILHKNLSDKLDLSNIALAIKTILGNRTTSSDGVSSLWMLQWTSPVDSGTDRTAVEIKVDSVFVRLYVDGSFSCLIERSHVQVL
jgi:hypothetical protein